MTCRDLLHPCGGFETKIRHDLRTNYWLAEASVSNQATIFLTVSP